MNVIADIVIGALVLALISFSVYLTIKRNKKGCCSCCNKDICNKNPKEQKKQKPSCCQPKTPEDIQR